MLHHNRPRGVTLKLELEHMVFLSMFSGSKTASKMDYCHHAMKMFADAEVVGSFGHMKNKEFRHYDAH